MFMIQTMPLLSHRCGKSATNSLTWNADARAMYKEVQGYFADGVSPSIPCGYEMLTIQLKVPDDGMYAIALELTDLK
jgi:hypothetical protein